MRTLLVALTGSLVLGTWIGAATAAETKDELTQREHQQNTLSQAREELAVAKHKLNDARVAYQNMRHHHRIRGAKKQQIIETVQRAEVELADAQEALDTATDAARRAGVQPGWFRLNPDALPASQTRE